MPAIDWSGSDKYSEHSCVCDCGGRWQTHIKAVNVDGQLRLVARKPCPECGLTIGLRAARGEPEEMILGRKES